MSNASGNQSDFDIIRRVVGGEVNDFESLLIKYKDFVLNLVRNHIPRSQAEEVTHIVFIKIYQALPTFKHKTGFKQWLSAIAVRTCYDFWRKEYQSRELPLSSLSEGDEDRLEKIISEQSSERSYEENAKREAGELLDWALERLSPEDRMVLELVFLEGLTAREAAHLLGWSIAKVKIRSHRSRRKLRKLLRGLIEERGGRA